jgi:hypothetical protein
MAQSGFNSLQGQEFSLLHSIQTGPGAHPAYIQWVTGALSLEVQQPGSG